MDKSGFVACVIPSGWRRVQLDDLTPSDRRIVYGIVQAGPHVVDGIPYIRSSDVGGRIRIDSLMRTTPEIAGRYRRSTVDAGDLIFSLRGNIGEMSVVPAELAGANLTQGTARISLGNGDSVEYVRYALQAPAVTRHIDKVSKGSTFREISIDQLRKVEIYLPPPPEQVAIARVLSFWDRAELHIGNLLKAKRRLKRSLMQELLTGKRRFKEFEGKRWIKQPLSVFFTEVDRRNDKNEDLTILSCTKTQGIVGQLERFGKRLASASIARYKVVHRGDLVYDPMLLWDGSIGFVQNYECGVVSPAYATFTSATRNADQKFFEVLFDSYYMRHQYKVISQGTNTRRRKAPADAFLGVEVPVPPTMDEQRRISKVFQTLDREIALLKEELKCLMEQKRGLMQKLLTGAVRVPLGAGQADAGAET